MGLKKALEKMNKWKPPTYSENFHQWEQWKDVLIAFAEEDPKPFFIFGDEVKVVYPENPVMDGKKALYLDHGEEHPTCEHILVYLDQYNRYLYLQVAPYQIKCIENAGNFANNIRMWFFKNSIQRKDGT